MSNESVVVIILRLAGFYIGVTSLWWLLQIAVTMPLVRDSGMFIAGSWGIGSLVVLAFAFFLIRFPRLITRRLLARKEAEEATTGWSADELQAVLFAVLGLYFATMSFTRLFAFALSLLVSFADPDVQPSIQRLGDLLAELFRLGVGLWLLFGAKGLHGLIRMARRAGR